MRLSNSNHTEHNYGPMDELDLWHELDSITREWLDRPIVYGGGGLSTAIDTGL